MPPRRQPNRGLQQPEGNIALAAIKTHKERLAGHSTLAAAARQAVIRSGTQPATETGNPTTQPIPPERQVRICVVCHAKNPMSTTAATWITNVGHALCDTHKLEHDETGHLPVMRLIHP